MAALSGKTPKTVLSGSEILPIQDGGELKRTDINAIVRKVADEQGARTVNLGTTPVAAQRTFEADGTSLQVTELLFTETAQPLRQRNSEQVSSLKKQTVQ